MKFDFLFFLRDCEGDIFRVPEQPEQHLTVDQWLLTGFNHSVVSDRSRAPRQHLTGSVITDRLQW